MLALKRPILGVDLNYNNRRQCAFLMACDGKGVAMDAVEYLYGKRHSRIGLLTKLYKNQYPFEDDVVSGYLVKTRQFGLPDCHFMVRYRKEEMGRDLHKIRKKISGLDALIVSSSSYAFEVVRILSGWGIKVPDNMSVLAIGGDINGEMMDPELTCFENDYTAMAKALYENLSGILENKITVPGTFLYKCFKLIGRESVMDRN